LIRGRYPGINVRPKTTIIIGRGRFESETERKERAQIRITYDVDEVFSYDELLDRAVETYRRLRSMTVVIPA